MILYLLRNLKKLSNSSKFETKINKKIIDQLSQCNSSYVLEVYTFILILDMSYTSVHIVSHSLKWNFHFSVSLIITVYNCGFLCIAPLYMHKILHICNVNYLRISITRPAWDMSLFRATDTNNL